MTTSSLSTLCWTLTNESFSSLNRRAYFPLRLIRTYSCKSVFLMSPNFVAKSRKYPEGGRFSPSSSLTLRHLSVTSSTNSFDMGRILTMFSSSCRFSSRFLMCVPRLCRLPWGVSHALSPYTRPKSVKISNLSLLKHVMIDCGESSSLVATPFSPFPPRFWIRKVSTGTWRI